MSTAVLVPTHRIAPSRQHQILPVSWWLLFSSSARISAYKPFHSLQGLLCFSPGAAWKRRKRTAKSRYRILMAASRLPCVPLQSARKIDGGWSLKKRLGKAPGIYRARGTVQVWRLSALSISNCSQPSGKQAGYPPYRRLQWNVQRTCCNPQGWISTDRVSYIMWPPAKPHRAAPIRMAFADLFPTQARGWVRQRAWGQPPLESGPSVDLGSIAHWQVT